MWFSDLNQANEEIAQMAVTIDRLRTEIKRLDNVIALGEERWRDYEGELFVCRWWRYLRRKA